MDYAKRVYNRRPNSAPIKDEKLKKKQKANNKRGGKLFNNIGITFDKIISLKNNESGYSSGLGLNPFIKHKNKNENSIYTGPVIKKRILN